MDLQDAFDAGFDAVKEYVDNSFAAFEKRIVALEQRPEARDGKDADPAAVAAIVATDIRKDIDALRCSVDALPKKAPELPDIPALVAQAVNAAMPEPVDVKALVIEAVAALPPARDGKDGAPGAKGEPGDIGPAGQPGKDGVGLAGAMIDRKGVLVLTLSDGGTRDLGIVVGKDADMATLEELVETTSQKAAAEAVAALPKPKDGETGSQGVQGEPGKSVTVEDVAPLIETAVAKHVETIERMVLDVVKSAVSAIPIPQAPQLPDIDAMVTKAVAALPPARDGKDADPALVQSLVAETVERAVAALPVAKDGKNGVDGRDGLDGKDGLSITIDDVRPLVEDTVTKAVTLIPAPKDGASVTIADVAPMIKAEIEKATSVIPSSIAKSVEDEIAKLPPAAAGKDADPVIVKQMVTEAVAALPAAKNGKDGVTIDELRPVIDETVAKAISAIPAPKDGKNGLDAVKFLRGDRGNLIVTMSNGAVEDLGEIDGKDVDMDAIERSIAEKVAAIPIPKDGRDGVDGLGFDDVTEELEDEGRIIVRRFFHSGQTVKESRIQTKMTVFRGVHDQTRVYQPGDMVSRGGSLWHCDAECQGPFNGDNFTLAVKKGRDGKGD